MFHFHKSKVWVDQPYFTFRVTYALFCGNTNLIATLQNLQKLAWKNVWQSRVEIDHFFLSCYCIRSVVAQNYQGSHTQHNLKCQVFMYLRSVYENSHQESSALQRFKHSNTIEISNGIMFMSISHLWQLYIRCQTNSICTFHHRYLVVLTTRYTSHHQVEIISRVQNLEGSSTQLTLLGEAVIAHSRKLNHNSCCINQCYLFRGSGSSGHSQYRGYFIIVAASPG